MSNFWRKFFIALIIILIVAIGITRVKIIRAEILLNKYNTYAFSDENFPFYTENEIIYT